MRRIVLPLALLLAVLATASCAQGNASNEDAYKIGCPAVDAALGGGTAMNRIAISGLEAVKSSGQLGPEATAWVNAAITGLKSGKPQDMPVQARKLIVDGCAQHGHPLQNLKG